MMKRKQSVRSQKRDVATWNAEVSVGAAVKYTNDRGEVKETHTRSEASMLSGHTAVVWLEGVSGCVALDRVKVNDAYQ